MSGYKVFRFAFGDYDIDGVLYKLNSEREIEDLILFSLKLNEAALAHLDTAKKFISENVIRAIKPIENSLKKLKIVAMAPSVVNLDVCSSSWEQALKDSGLQLNEVSVDIWPFDQLLGCVAPEFKMLDNSPDWPLIDRPFVELPVPRMLGGAMLLSGFRGVGKTTMIFKKLSSTEGFVYCNLKE